MIGFMKKDVLISKQYFFILAVYIPLMYLLNLSPLFFFYAVTYGLVVGIFYYDSQGKINRFAVSLPVSREKIVLSRFLFLTITLVVIYMYQLVIDLAAHRFFDHLDFKPMAPISVFTYLCGAFIVMALSVPFYYSFSYTMAIVTNLTFFTIVPSLLFFLFILLDRWSNGLLSAGFKSVVKFFVEFYPVLTLGATLIVGFLSYSLSKRIFLRKNVT